MLVLLLCIALSPMALAATPEEILDEQANSLGLEELEKVGEAYAGETDLKEGVDVSEAFSHMLQMGKDALGQIVKGSVRSCVLILVVTLLAQMADGMRAGSGGDPMRVSVLAATLTIAGIAVGDVHALLSLGEDAMFNMQTVGDVLLPAVSMATAMSGTPATALVKHGATILFSDALIRLIEQLLVPLCYAYVAANVAWAALGNNGLKRIGALLKWLIVTVLSILLLVFIAYLNLSGVISGSTDAATVKATKFTISHLVPVVGGVIADTAETLLAGASILRNTAGVFGMLAVMGICIVPFLNLGAHYLAYKCTAALAATASEDGRVTGLIDALGSAFGLVLAMTGSCAMLLIVAMVSSVSAVVG